MMKPHNRITSRPLITSLPFNLQMAFRHRRSRSPRCPPLMGIKDLIPVPRYPRRRVSVRHGGIRFLDRRQRGLCAAGAVREVVPEEGKDG